MKSGNTPAAQDFYAGIETPDVTKMQLQLKELVQQGVMTPEDAQAALTGDSSFNGITLDPALKQNQMSALDSLMDIGNSGGMTMADKANLSHIASDEMTQQRGQRDSIIQNAQQRGLGGSGLDLMAQLQNQQDSATRQSQKDLDVAGQAQARALQALQQGGAMSGQMMDQSFNQQAQKANAQDAISKFNAQNQQQTNMANTAAHNQAQASNLATKQDIANQNVAQSNQQQQYNKQLAQQDFDNKIKKAGGQSGVALQNAQAAGANSAGAANAFNQMLGTAIGAGATAYSGGANKASDERGKKDIHEMDSSDFLDKITGYKYKYKDPEKNGEGDNFGPMAQDLEKSDIGKSMVSDTPDGKMVDTNKAAMAALGVIADLHERIKKMENA
jgi:hypothetical protein